ncbi:MAG: hypothetical protein KDE56_01700 [Anaerolineales bacterium]|nr:hypothetical protein [Anaerolineales bacterium]
MAVTSVDRAFRRTRLAWNDEATRLGAGRSPPPMPAAAWLGVWCRWGVV